VGTEEKRSSQEVTVSRPRYNRLRCRRKLLVNGVRYDVQLVDGSQVYSVISVAHSVVARVELQRRKLAPRSYPIEIPRTIDLRSRQGAFSNRTTPNNPKRQFLPVACS